VTRTKLKKSKKFERYLKRERERERKGKRERER
jgi:hypothetical protein